MTKVLQTLVGSCCPMEHKLELNLRGLLQVILLQTMILVDENPMEGEEDQSLNLDPPILDGSSLKMAPWFEDKKHGLEHNTKRLMEEFN